MQSPFSYAQHSQQNSHVNIPVSDLTAGNLKMQHEHIERATEAFEPDNNNPLNFPNPW